MLKSFANNKYREILIFAILVMFSHMPSLLAQSDTRIQNTFPKVICCGIKYFENPVCIMDSSTAGSMTIDKKTYYRKGFYVLENSLFDSAGRDIRIAIEKYRDNCIACDLVPFPAFILDHIIPALTEDCPCYEALSLSYPNYPIPSFIYDMVHEEGSCPWRKWSHCVNHHSFMILLVQVGLYNQYHNEISPALYRYSMDPDAQKMYMLYAIPIKE